MKYFTPNLLAECRSLNPDIAEAAAARWQKQAEANRDRLQEIQHRLPFGVRQLMRAITLHDASLLSINLAQGRGRNQFSLSFQLAGGDRRSGVQLRYDIVKPLKVVLHEPNAGDLRVASRLRQANPTGGQEARHSQAATSPICYDDAIPRRVRPPRFPPCDDCSSRFCS